MALNVIVDPLPGLRPPGMTEISHVSGALPRVSLRRTLHPGGAEGLSDADRAGSVGRGRRL